LLRGSRRRGVQVADRDSGGNRVDAGLGRDPGFARPQAFALRRAAPSGRLTAGPLDIHRQIPSSAVACAGPRAVARLTRIGCTLPHALRPMVEVTLLCRTVNENV